MSTVAVRAFDENIADGFHAEANAAEAEQLSEVVESFLKWAQRIPTAKGNRLDFDRFPFQREVYEVMGDAAVLEADVMKSIQVGMSELLTRLTMYFPDLRGMTGLYVFPALKQMHDFSDTRVNPLREQSEYLQSRTKLTSEWTWNKGLKRVGSGFVYYRGSESKNDLIAVDADIVAMDEYDLLHPPNIPEAEKRVAASPVGLIRRVGVPSDPEYGIAKRYAQSDMRKWLVKCKCKEGWQELDFFKNLKWDEVGGVVENPRIVCRRCSKPLDVLKGKWVAEHPERNRPGFHVHRLMVPGERNLRTIIADSKETDPVLIESFWNNDLGLPYTSQTGGLDRKAIAAALSAAESFLGFVPRMQDAYDGPNIVTMGVDVASTRALNIRISEHLDPTLARGHRKRALWIGKVESFNDLPGLMDRFNVQFAVIDHLPEGRLSRGFAQMFPGRVWVANYSQQQIEAMVVNTDDLRVSAKRTEVLDATVAVMRALRNLLPEDIPPEYVEHMVRPRRKVERDEHDRTVVVWEEKGPTDYFHAEVYDFMATEVAKVRLQFEDLTREETWQLDERLEFERSRVNEYGDNTYRPGPGGDDDFDYRGGPGD